MAPPAPLGLLERRAPSALMGSRGGSRSMAARRTTRPSPKHAEATCPAGKVLIGGGAIQTSDTLNTPVALKNNGPVSTGSTTWYADGYETTATAENWNIQLTIWCANPTP